MRGRCAAKLTHLAVNPTPPPLPTAPPPCPTYLRGAAEMPPRAPSVPRVPRPQPTPAQAVWLLAWPRWAAAPTLQFPPSRPPSAFLAGKKDRRWADGLGAPVSAPRSSPVQLTTQNWGHLGGPGRPRDWLVSGGRWLGVVLASGVLPATVRPDPSAVALLRAPLGVYAGHTDWLTAGAGGGGHWAAQRHCGALARRPRILVGRGVGGVEQGGFSPPATRAGA